MTYDQNCIFYDVEGIPVTMGAGESIPFCAAWDKAEPRQFDINSAVRNGYQITQEAFEAMIDSQAAS